MIRVSRGWTQGVWTLLDQRLLMVILVWQAAVRGADYWRGSGVNSTDFDLLLSAFTLRVVGSGFLVPAILVALGMVLNRHSLAWLGHSLLMLAYYVMAITIIVQIIAEGYEGYFSWVWLSIFTLAGAALAWTGLKAVIPPETLSRVGIGMVMLVGLVSLLFISPQALDSGLRFPGHLVAVGTMHLLWAVRMGPAPLDSKVDGKTEMEIVVGERDADVGGN